ncbi:MAG: methyltransferase domain-containing protein [Burkholderiaceae bacterium]
MTSDEAAGAAGEGAGTADDAELHDALARAVDDLRHDRLEPAQDALIGILQRWPAQPDALQFLGLLRHAQGLDDEALGLIAAAIEQRPGHAGYWNNLGNVLAAMRRDDEAAEAWRRSIDAAGDDHPDAADALANLARLHRRGGRLGEAQAALERAIALRPDFADAWYGLSRVLITQGRVHDGLVAHSKAVLLWPQHGQAREQVLRALVLLGERDRAAQLYREWLAEDPDNPVARHQLAACGGEPPPARASDGYVSEVFDAFAPRFDASLERLQYRAPQAVARALAAARGAPRGDASVVDLGCGTGLVGPLVRPWARRLAGCDLSVGMLRQARRRGVYAVLHQAELVYYLRTQPQAFDAAVCADTLCYFGDLNEVMQAAARALRPGGQFVFTVEALADDEAGPHRLRATGRYAHAREHLAGSASAAGLEPGPIEAVELRLEAGEPVRGWLARVARPAAP